MQSSMLNHQQNDIRAHPLNRVDKKGQPLSKTSVKYRWPVIPGETNEICGYSPIVG